VKVTPSNQTLILANERPYSGEKSSTRLDQALNAAASGAVLKRVTIVAARSDAVVVVRADYSSKTDEAPADSGTPGNAVTTLLRAGSAMATLPRPISQETGNSDSAGGSTRGGLATVAKVSGAKRDAYGNLQAANRDGGASSYLKPAEQYARTQRILVATPEAGHIDVHA
jgi:hypothetical protein